MLVNDRCLGSRTSGSASLLPVQAYVRDCGCYSGDAQAAGDIISLCMGEGTGATLAPMNCASA